MCTWICIRVGLICFPMWCLLRICLQPWIWTEIAFPFMEEKFVRSRTCAELIRVLLFLYFSACNRFFFSIFQVHCCEQNCDILVCRTKRKSAKIYVYKKNNRSIFSMVCTEQCFSVRLTTAFILVWKRLNWMQVKQVKPLGHGTATRRHVMDNTEQKKYVERKQLTKSSNKYH